MKIISISTETGNTPREVEGFYANMEAAVRHFGPRLLEIAEELYDEEYDLTVEIVKFARLANESLLLPTDMRVKHFMDAIDLINEHASDGSDHYVYLEQDEVLE